MTRRESLWDEEQQGVMLALARYRDLCCPGCGGWLPETTAAEGEDRYRFEMVRCHRCTGHSMAVDKSRDMYRPESLLLREIEGR